MNTCPHCNAPLPGDSSRCPECGAEYWNPGQAQAPPALDDQNEDHEGCASLLMVPILVSLGVTAFLIFTGFVLNALAHFESQQFKLLWLGGSLVVGALVYRVFQRLKQQKIQQKYDQNGGMGS